VAFYEASAQILPVLVLAATVELLGVRRTLREQSATTVAVGLATMLLLCAFAIAGQAAALSALLCGGTSEWAEDTVEVALVGSAVPLVFMVVSPFLAALDEHGHRWLGFATSGAIMVAQLPAIVFLILR
jgi:hypothetical protein